MPNSTSLPTEIDVLAIGAGPFNLGLGALAAPLVEAGEFSLRILDQRSEFSWHPGMLLPEATIQVPFLADLVTLADPTSPFSFLNYCKQSGRLHHFYIKEDFFPLRSEYSDYCAWVSRSLPVHWNHRVTRVTKNSDGGFKVYYSHPGAEDQELCTRARTLICGIGTEPFIPAELADAAKSPNTIHSADYLFHREQLKKLPSLTIIGSGQSAAEIYLDLLPHCADTGQQLTWVTRSPRFFPMEYTKLSLELTSPDYARYLRGLSAEARDQLNRSQRNLYKGISSSTINRIYDELYRLSRTSTLNTSLRANVAARCETISGIGQITLTDQTTGEESMHCSDGLILATGYRAPRIPDFLIPLGEEINKDSQGRLAFNEDFSVNDARSIFLHNADEHLTSLIAPDLGMGPWRNSIILRSITGREVYPIEQAFAFQQFGGSHDA